MSDLPPLIWQKVNTNLYRGRGVPDEDVRWIVEVTRLPSGEWQANYRFKTKEEAIAASDNFWRCEVFPGLKDGLNA